MLVAEGILGTILIISSLGVILNSKPVYSCLSFMVTLLMLAALYLQLSAQFIAVMQVLVYAGAILVIFMFVIVLFQDAHEQIARFKAQSSRFLLSAAAIIFLVAAAFLGRELVDFNPVENKITDSFGTVESLGHKLYVDFFFPFEAVILVFLIALIGALYIGRKVK